MKGKGFIEAVGTALRKYVQFKGTASRSEYWWFVVFSLGTLFTTGLLDRLLYPAETLDLDRVLRGLEPLPATPFTAVLIFLLILPLLSVTARRFHDAGHSAKWLYLLIIPGGYALLATVGIALIIFSYESVSVDLLLPIYFLIFPVAVTTVALAVVYLVFLLKPTKTFFEGNLLADPNIPDWPYGIEGSTS